jgi:para-nitrobenzyl esterase
VTNRVALRPVIRAILAMASVALDSTPVMAALNEPVRTDAGLVSGQTVRGSSITVYRGIPFAASPAGELRWRPPQPPNPWQGVRKAEHFGSSCPQSGQMTSMS